MTLEEMYGKGKSMRLHLLKSIGTKHYSLQCMGEGGREHGDFSFCYISFLYIPSFSFGR